MKMFTITINTANSSLTMPVCDVHTDTDTGTHKAAASRPGEQINISNSDKR